jgi:branched-chain amino acid transport system permease protein
MAIGKSIVFNVMHVINVAQGWIAMLGGYAAYWLFTLYGMDPFLSLFFHNSDVFADRRRLSHYLFEAHHRQGFPPSDRYHFQRCLND